eukprot:14224367-Ditylum_brightwellii.AAC.1
MDPEFSQPIEEETKAEEVDADEEESKAKEVDVKEEDDEVVDASEGENELKSEMPAPTTTQSGCVTKLPQYLADNYNLSEEYGEIFLTPAEINFYAQMRELNEINCLSIEGHGSENEKECGPVGAAAGSAFKNTREL